jgi:5S rRNA maturation endonuclease (ribonuclease M5)
VAVDKTIVILCEGQSDEEILKVLFKKEDKLT